MPNPRATLPTKSKTLLAIDCFHTVDQINGLFGKSDGATKKKKSLTLVEIGSNNVRTQITVFSPHIALVSQDR